MTAIVLTVCLPFPLENNCHSVGQENQQ